MPYYVVSGDKGILNFIRSDPKVPIIQFHPNLNNKGHLAIPNSKLNLKLPEADAGLLDYEFGTIFTHTFDQAIIIGHKVWLMNGVIKQSYSSLDGFDATGAVSPYCKSITGSRPDGHKFKPKV